MLTKASQNAMWLFLDSTSIKLTVLTIATIVGRAFNTIILSGNDYEFVKNPCGAESRVVQLSDTDDKSNEWCEPVTDEEYFSLV